LCGTVFAHTVQQCRIKYTKRKQPTQTAPTTDHIKLYNIVYKSTYQFFYNYYTWLLKLVKSSSGTIWFYAECYITLFITSCCILHTLTQKCFNYNSSNSDDWYKPSIICDQILEKRSKSHISQNQTNTTNG